MTVAAPTTVTPMNTVGISADIQRHCVSSAVNAHRNDTTIAANKPLKNAFRTSIVSPKLAKPHNDFLNDTPPAPYPDRQLTPRRKPLMTFAQGTQAHYREHPQIERWHPIPTLLTVAQAGNARKPSRIPPRKPSGIIIVASCH